MRKKKTKRRKAKPAEPLVFMEGCSMELRISERLHKEPETIRRLAHRVVDLLVDAGHHDWMSDSVACNVGRLADSVVVDHVTELIREARASGKGVAGG